MPPSATHLIPATRLPDDADLPRRVVLLDEFCVLDAGAQVELPLSAQRVVAFLALQRRATREGIAGSLWPDSSGEHAHGSLRSALWRLQKHCTGLVRSHAGQLTLSHTHVDLDDLRELALLSGGSSREPSALALAATRSGVLLPGWDDDWVVPERERVRQLHLHALETVGSRLAAAACFAAALEAALRLVALEPLRESAHRLVVSVHLQEGNVAEALRQYDVCRRSLLAEVGVPPSRSMRELFERAGVPVP